MTATIYNVQFAEDVYYELRSPRLQLLKADENKQVWKRRGDIFLCIGIIAQGRKRYAVLVHQNEDGDHETFRHRVSRYTRGKGEWRELNPMMVVALADRLPSS